MPYLEPLKELPVLMIFVNLDRHAWKKNDNVIRLKSNFVVGLLLNLSWFANAHTHSLRSLTKQLDTIYKLH